MTTFITPILRKTALGIAGLTLGAGAAAGPLATLATPAHAAPATPATPVVLVPTDKPADSGNHDSGTNDKAGTNDKKAGTDDQAGTNQKKAGTNDKAGTNQKKAGKELGVKYQPQPNFYYCGPAATRNALTADGTDVNMDDLARQMGTTEAGTNSAHDITAALNKVTGKGYTTTEISGQRASDEQKNKLRADLTDALNNNRAVVANIAGTATDTDGAAHSYQGGHYIAVHGYRDGGQQVKIADSANPDTASYWITTDALADWIATRGYSH
jgi:Peptidase_C39 like family